MAGEGGVADALETQTRTQKTWTTMTVSGRLYKTSGVCASECIRSARD